MNRPSDNRRMMIAPAVWDDFIVQEAAYDVERPAWADANGYGSVRALDDGLWLIIRPMIGDIQLAVCEPPPFGGILEFWDYDADALGLLDCIHAFAVFPARDTLTERWNRHVDPTGHDRRDARSVPR